jgi:hypothetical protein
MLGAQVKIIDFGFATRLDSNKNLAFSTLGSPINMDPGILKRLNNIDNNRSGYDEKVDIWSLGTVCYEMLIGKATFEAENMRELVTKIETGEYTIPTSLSKEVVSFLNAMLQYDSNYRLSSEELSRHYFLTKNVKDFTKIDIKKVQKNLTGNDDLLKINVKQNQSIWALFNNEKALDEVPGYILNEKKDDNFLAPIPETDNGNTFQNNNNNVNNNPNSKYNNFVKNYAHRNNFGNNVFTNHLAQKNNNINNNNVNYPNLSNNPVLGTPNTSNSSSSSNQSTPQTNTKRDLRIDLQKAFDAINEDFIYISPIFIPLIPGNDPLDKYNEEEHI